MNFYQYIKLNVLITLARVCEFTCEQGGGEITGNKLLRTLF